MNWKTVEMKTFKNPKRIPGIFKFTTCCLLISVISISCQNNSQPAQPATSAQNADTGLDRTANAPQLSKQQEDSVAAEKSEREYLEE